MNNQNSPKSGLIIGFSGTYYCLWSYSNETNYSMSGNGNYVATSGYTKYYYIKRISTDLEKVKQLYPNVPIDMDVHGTKWVYDKKEKVKYPADVFPQGFRGVGSKIMECNEAKFLWTLYLTNNLNQDMDLARSQVYARRRLVELGCLVRYNTYKTIKLTALDENGHEYFTGEEITLRNNFCSPAYAEKLALDKVKQKGHFFDDGKRVKLSIKQTNSFSFETQYGLCFIIELMDTDNRVYKYKGANPPYFEKNKDGFVDVQATIKHGCYKNEPETLLQRISFIK